MKHIPTDMIHANAYRIVQHPPETGHRLPNAWWLIPVAALGCVSWFWLISALLSILG